MELASFIKIEDIYDERIADIFVLTMSIIGCIGTVSSICVLLIIFFKSTASMKTFKLCLLCYAFCNLAIELTILLYKPIYIPQLIMLYPRGFLSPMNDVTSKILSLMVFICACGIMIIFLIMLIERYAAMSIHPPLARWNFYKHPTFYIVLLWIFLPVIALFFIFIVFALNAIYPAKETFELIQKYVIGSEQFLSFQPSLIRVNQDIVKLLSPIFFVIILAYTFFLILYFVLCFKALKNSSAFSAKTWETNKMLFKSVCFQFLTMISMIVLPLFLLIVLVALNLTSKYIFYFIVMIPWVFPIVDHIVIIMTIAPYRIFVLGKFKCFRYWTESHVVIKPFNAVRNSENTRS